jgi:glycosyltransferase involved in cell wall biosynthesis
VHIAFFNRSYHPDQTATGQLLTELCEHLARDHACRVTVVTGLPLNPLDGHDAPMRERHNGVDIVRARGTRLSKSRFAGRASNYITYFLSACYAGWRLDAPNVVVALTDPPIVGLAAWLAGLRHRAPLVMAFQDIFPEVAMTMEDFQSPVVNAALQSVNRFLVRRAARSIAIGEMIQPGPRDNAFARANDLSGRFVVMHSGNLGLSQSLETLVDAAALLGGVPDVRLVFQGEGVKKAQLEARAKALGLTNVMFLPFAPKTQLGESLSAADVCLVSLRRGLAGYIVPSKLYGILAAGRPFIAAVEAECEVASLARTHDCGMVIEPGDARALADAILACRADRARLAKMGANARAIATSFDRASQVARYFDVCQAAARKAQPGTVAAARGEAHVGRG